MILLGEFDKKPLKQYNNGINQMGVGAEMAKERDYKREAETAKKRGEVKIGVKASKQLNEDFAQQCAKNGTNKNAVLKRYIERYTYENFDQ